MAHQVSFFSMTFLLYSALNQASSEVYHITASSISTNLYTGPCLTLSELAANLSHCLSSNTTLVFLPGIHYLTVNVSISNVHNFSTTSESIPAQVLCRNNSHFHFNNSQHISIFNMEFIGCVGNEVEKVEEFVVKDTKFSGKSTNDTALDINETTTKIINCSYELHRKGRFKEFQAMGRRFLIDRGAFIGGAIIATGCEVNITQSRFEKNGAEYGGAIVAQKNSTIIIHNSIFTNNFADHGGVLFSLASNITIESSEFNINRAKEGGGVLYCLNSIIALKASEFAVNAASSWFDEGSGGVLHSLENNITVERSKFNNNTAGLGGVLRSSGSTITIKASTFDGNTATSRGRLSGGGGGGGGGVLYSSQGSVIINVNKFDLKLDTWMRTVGLQSDHDTITIEESKFTKNNANSGGVLFSEHCVISLVTSMFYDNYAISKGGVLYSEGSSITIDSVTEGVVDTDLDLNGSLKVENNVARYATIHLSNSEFIIKYSGRLILSNNVGSLVAFNSYITFMGSAEFINNQPKHSTTATFKEGGAITLFQSIFLLDGNCSLQYNHAEDGGGLLSMESNLYVRGDVTVAHNTAISNGGGVYLSNSELNCRRKSTLQLYNNHAGQKGGGLHAISSSIKATAAHSSRNYTGTKLKFTKNIAEMGGGLSLQANAKLYILKDDKFGLRDTYDANTTIFIANNACYGGGVYVDDDINSGTCTSNSKTECFFQVLAAHGEEDDDLRTQSIFFSQNHANISGSTLYGGLLDRCAVSQFAEVRYKISKFFSQKYQYFKDADGGIAYFKNISVPTHKRYSSKEDFIVTNISISSSPVKVCICIENERDCSRQLNVKVKKGKAFNISLVAVDQIEQPVNATIHASLESTESGLSEGQMTTKIQGECSDLTFNVFSPHKYENLILYALDGPCKDADLSRRLIKIEFLPCSCPIGFQISGKKQINCTCDCHNDISQYTKYCDSLTESFIKKFQSRAWIFYINETNLTGYLIYKNYPFDYCNSLSLPVDLNQPNGADAQCAFNRSSLLCGSCRPDLSLSLGSSRCLPCPSYWPVLLIAITLTAILAGIALVTLLLFLNMTVAVGALNGLVFYANVVHANKSILLPFQETNFVTVLISLLNLELGVDTCYFPEMDTYIKTWLQLAFPAFVLYLVILVIIVSSYSIRFSKLIGNKDPVATLATLILLSYAKILQICFESLSVGILRYPDGSNKALWLPDATVQYLHGKHVPLFIAAVLILLVGMIYSALLFLWQWRFYLPRWKIFTVMCLRNQKLQFFIETYHAFFTPKHRYWTGLLLIARAILYLVAAANVSNDPQLALSAIVFTVSFILLLIAFIDIRIYKKAPVNILETFFILNLLLFSVFTWYSLSSTNINQKAVAYTSVLSAFMMLMLILLYHVCTYTSIFSRLNFSRMINIFRADPSVRAISHLKPPPDDNIHRFNELLDIIAGPANTNDYNVPLLDQQPVKPTYSVVELPKPQHTDEPVPEEAIIRDVPGPGVTADAV